MSEFVQMNVRLTPQLLAWVKKSAKADRRSLNNFITVLLEEHRFAEEHGSHQNNCGGNQMT